MTEPGAAEVCGPSLYEEGILTGFFCQKPGFSAKRKIFLQIHRNTLEISKVDPIRRLARRAETYPILETFLFLFTTRRFGGVVAPEGREKCLTKFSAN